MQKAVFDEQHLIPDTGCNCRNTASFSDRQRDSLVTLVPMLSQWFIYFLKNYIYFFHYSWFTEFWQFLLYRKVTQSHTHTHTHTHTCVYIYYTHTHIYIHILFLTLSSIMFHHKVTRYSSLCYKAGSHC